MDIREVEEPIASRTLMMGQIQVVVTIGKPRLFEDGDDYFCPYSIAYEDFKKVSYAGGMDSIQAMLLAMKKIGSDLVHIAQTKGAAISWLPDVPGDTGFPD